MRREIAVLDGNVADKIAAGEVIERPASVVKELVENAIDADAKRVHVDIWQAGQQSIRVKDDGVGMHASQAHLAFSRHATSKIKDAGDLTAIRTLGFRGEALPSIASVSKVLLMTRTESEETGVKVEAQSGRIDVAPCHAPTGTDIEVRDLFYNTPARRKFLKSETAERRAIVEYVMKVALARPDISFSLVMEGKENMDTPGNGDLKQTIGAIFGREVMKDLLPARADSPWGKVSGYVGRPQLARGNRGACFVFINGRWVQNRNVYVAVEKGYEALLAFRRYPFAVINIDMDPTLVDVNVHPAKTEVRFRDDREVFRVIVRSVREALVEADLTTPLTSSAASGSSQREPAVSPSYPSGQGMEVAQAAQVNESSQTRLRWSRDLAGITRISKGEMQKDTVDDVEWISGESQSDRGRTQASDWAGRPVFDGRKSRGLPTEIDVRDVLLEGEVLGQIGGAYILVKAPDGLWIIDQHIAHERVLYESFLKSTGGEPVVSQDLLAPERITLSPAQAATLMDSSQALASAGFHLEPFGGNDYILRSVPVTAGSNPGAILMEMLEELSQEEGSGTPLNERLAASFACRAAVKAGDALRPEELAALVRQLALADNPFACPHGRPIIIKMKFEEIARRFERI